MGDSATDSHKARRIRHSTEKGRPSNEGGIQRVSIIKGDYGCPKTIQDRTRQTGHNRNETNERAISDRDLPCCPIYERGHWKDGENGGQGGKWANLLREGNPTNACYIGKRRALLHVVLKV